MLKMINRPEELRERKGRKETASALEHAGVGRGKEERARCVGSVLHCLYFFLSLSPPPHPIPPVLILHGLVGRFCIWPLLDGVAVFHFRGRSWHISSSFSPRSNVEGLAVVFLPPGRVGRENVGDGDARKYLTFASTNPRTKPVGSNARARLGHYGYILKLSLLPQSEKKTLHSVLILFDNIKSMFYIKRKTY